MKKISILKNGVITNIIELEASEADSVFQRHVNMGTFGRSAYSYEQEVETQPAVLDEHGVEISPAQFELQTINVPAEYEVIIEDTTEEITLEERIKEMIRKGKPARETCEKVLDLIGGFNIDRVLTMEQITQMQSTFSNAEAALKANRPGFAKTFISQITPDGDLVTQEMKDLCLEILKNW